MRRAGYRSSMIGLRPRCEFSRPSWLSSCCSRARNIATLLLARAEVRQRETAIRLAIGAGYGRLMRQFLTEGAVLAAAGGALGVLVAWSTARTLLVLLSTDGTPVPIDVSPNVRVLGFAIGVSCLTVLIFALGPAVLALRGLTSGLKGGPRSAAPSAGTRADRRAGGIVRPLSSTSPRCSSERSRIFATTIWASPMNRWCSSRSIPKRAGWFRRRCRIVSRRIIDRLSRLPGVEAVTVSHYGFATGVSRTCCIAVEGHTHYRGEEREVATLGVAPGYLSGGGAATAPGTRLPASREHDGPTTDAARRDSQRGVRSSLCGNRQSTRPPRRLGGRSAEGGVHVRDHRRGEECDLRGPATGDTPASVFSVRRGNTVHDPLRRT